MYDSFKKPIRVLHVVRKMDIGGAENLIMNWYRFIDKKKIQFDFLVHQDKESYYEEEIKALGGRLFQIKPMNGFNPGKYYRDCKSFFRMHKDISIVHGHIGSCSALYLKAAKSEGCFTIAHSHSVGNVTSIRDIAFKLYSYPTRLVSEAFLGCSTEAGLSRYGRNIVNSDKYNNFPNAIDISKFEFKPNVRYEVRKELGIDDRDILIGTVGRIVHAKNPHFILEVFNELIKLNNDIKCIWVGYGSLADEIKKHIIGKGLVGKIILTGKRNDIDRILQAVDCFIMPSLYEGLPVSAIEAQSSGVPCVLSDRITKEVEVSDLIEWRSLKDSAKTWALEANRLGTAAKKYRYSPLEVIRNNGYDIHIASKKLEEYYISKSKTLT